MGKPQLGNLAEYLSELSKYGDFDVAYPYFDTYSDEGARCLISSKRAINASAPHS